MQVSAPLPIMPTGAPSHLMPPGPRREPVRSTDNLRFQIAAWSFFCLVDLLMLSTFEAVTWRKSANVILGLFLCATFSQGMWLTVMRIGWSPRKQTRLLALIAALCTVGGAAIAFVMQPVERWAKLAPGAGLPPAEFGGLWLFYALMLALWSIFAAAFFFYDRARQVEVENAQFAAAVREAELHAMRLQINPHFLFNSFATLRALVEIDPRRAREAISQLSGMMRYSLTSAGSRTVALREELAMVRNFLDVERLRLGERLQVHAHCEAGLEALRVPPFSLQTLVENAVKFGVASRRAGGRITYTVRRDGDHLDIVVTNPGSLNSPSASTGLGLPNLRARLEHLWSDDASLAITQSAPDTVQAHLRIPVQTDEDPAR